MARIEPFEKHHEAYDAWFERNREKHVMELRAVKALMPPRGRGLEVGVGTGRFAAPLGIATGVEPSRTMAERARRLGLRVVQAVAERLPFADRSFDYVLMVTTVCFVDDLDRSFREAHRVIGDGGFMVVGFVDRESALGREYLRKKDTSPFYGAATFYSTRELMDRLAGAGFRALEMKQTLLPDGEGGAIEPGHGRRGFVVIRARKEPGSSVGTAV